MRSRRAEVAVLRVSIGVLVILATAASVLVVRAEDAAGVASSAERTNRRAETPGTPVLSPRRAPALIARELGQRRLVAAMEEIWRRHPSSSCLVVAEGSSVLYARRPEYAVVPASALKLLTASVALRLLGDDTRFTTSVRAGDVDKGGVVRGDLWLVGGGDPVLGTQAWAERRTHQPPVTSSLEALADRVVEAGVREVRGRVLGDDSRYDSVRSIASWPRRYLDAHEIGPLGALVVNDGFAAWEPELVPFDDPTGGAARVFTELLAARGVSVTGEPGSGTAPAASVEIAQLRSPTLATLVSDMIRESDNGTAELLVKELGFRATGEGSTAAGLEAMRTTLNEMVSNPGDVQLVDGSGLDPTNRISCTALQALAAGIEAGGPIDRGLAVAGFSGTLTKRFLDSPAKGRLRAKTGSLNHVAALVGRVEGGVGTVLTFTQVVNDIDTLASGRRLQDELGAALARYPEVPSLDSLAPLAPVGTHP